MQGACKRAASSTGPWHTLRVSCCKAPTYSHQDHPDTHVETASPPTLCSTTCNDRVAAPAVLGAPLHRLGEPSLLGNQGGPRAPHTPSCRGACPTTTHVWRPRVQEAMPADEQPPKHRPCAW